MNMFDSNRTYLSSRPKLSGYNSVIPNLYLLPINETQIKINIMIHYDNRSYFWAEKDFAIDELPKLLKEYITNPEEFLALYFDHGKEPTKPYQGLTFEATFSEPELEFDC